MADDALLTKAEVETARRRREVGMALQAIEGHPLDAEDVALLEMLERERWSHEKCRAYILALAEGRPLAAE